MTPRTLSIGARVSPEENALITHAAVSLGLKPAEFVRQASLTAAGHTDPLTYALVAETLAIRRIFNNVVVFLTTAGQTLDADTLRTITRYADEHKDTDAHNAITRAYGIVVPTPKPPQD